MRPTKRQTAAYKQGFYDGSAGKPSRISKDNTATNAYAASTEYMTGYAVGKQTLEAKTGAK